MTLYLEETHSQVFEITEPITKILCKTFCFSKTDQQESN